MRFTVVFEGDLRKLSGNPFKVISQFGKPVTIADSDLTDEIADLRQELEKYMELANRNEELLDSVPSHNQTREDK